MKRGRFIRKVQAKLAIARMYARRVETAWEPPPGLQYMLDATLRGMVNEGVRVTPFGDIHAEEAHAIAVTIHRTFEEWENSVVGRREIAALRRYKRPRVGVRLLPGGVLDIGLAERA